jgi:hypothetical protein
MQGSVRTTKSAGVDCNSDEISNKQQKAPTLFGFSFGIGSKKKTTIEQKDAYSVLLGRPLQDLDTMKKNGLRARVRMDSTVSGTT